MENYLKDKKYDKIIPFDLDEFSSHVIPVIDPEYKRDIDITDSLDMDDMKLLIQGKNIPMNDEDI